MSSGEKSEGFDIASGGSLSMEERLKLWRQEKGKVRTGQLRGISTRLSPTPPGRRASHVESLHRWQRWRPETLQQLPSVPANRPAQAPRLASPDSRSVFLRTPPSPNLTGVTH